MQRLVTEDVVAKLLGFTTRKLQNDRSAKRGLPFYRLGRAVRYDLDEVEAWVRARASKPATGGQ